MNNWLRQQKKSVILLSCFIFFTAPASTNYQLDSYEFGSGGGTDLNSSQYQLEGVVGGLSDDQSSSSYRARSGLLGAQLANTPGAPTLENTGDWYNKLKITLDTGGNPADAEFAIAVSQDGFVTTEYVQDDSTLGPGLGDEDFQTYAAWGGSSGTFIIDLEPCETYEAKVKARQGNFTEGPFGPVSAQAFVSCPELQFDIDVSDQDIETLSSSYTVDFGTLTLGTVVDAVDKVWIDLDTNAQSGAIVFVKGDNEGLESSSTGYKIPSVTGDLAILSEGFGIQGLTATQTSGGPITVVSPYDGSAQNIGLIDSALREILTSSLPLEGGRASFVLKTKAQTGTPASENYTEVLTFIASGVY